MSENEFYKTFCLPQFSEIKENQKEFSDKVDKNFKELFCLLKGKNGDPGVLDDIRDNTKLRKRINWIGVLVVGAFITNIILFVFYLIREKLS